MSSHRYPTSKENRSEKLMPTVGKICHPKSEPSPNPPISLYTRACNRRPGAVRSANPTMGSTQV